MATPGRKNSKEAVARRRAVVADLYLKGYYQSEIARQTRVSQQQISADIRHLMKEWQKSALTDYDEAMQQELARINKRETEAWDAWERSKTQFKKRTIKGKAIGEGDTNLVEKSEQTEERNGDPRYLTIVENCSKQRCELLGLNKAPIKEPEELNINLSGLTAEELLTIAKIKSKINVA